MSSPLSPIPVHMPSPAHRVLSTLTVPEARRLQYWMELVCETYCHLHCVPPGNERLFGRIEIDDLGDMQITRVQSNGVRLLHSQERDGGDASPYLALIAGEGGATLLQDGRIAVLRPGDFALHDCTRPYELAFAAQRHDVRVLQLPRLRLDAQVSNLDNLTAVPVAAQSGPGQLLQSMVSTVLDGRHHLHSASTNGITEAIISVVSAGLRSLPNAAIGQASNLTAYHVARIKAYMREHLRDPNLTVGSIAAALHLPPERLCRLFRDQPLPLSRLIWKLRLDACCRELADPLQRSRSVSDIAFSWGFNDAGHFSRSFRQQHGMSPTEWRHQRQIQHGLLMNAKAR